MRLSSLCRLMFLLAVVALVLQVPAVVDDGSGGPGNARADARRNVVQLPGPHKS
jgi:hypothetical protein